MREWTIYFEENVDEYEGYIIVTGKELVVDENSDRIIIVDGVKIQIDERIIRIEEE